MDGLTGISRALRDLMDRAVARFPYTSEHYPKTHLDCGIAFELSHSVLHMATTVGDISREAQRLDHGGRANPQVLREATVKMMVHALRLAASLGMKPEEIARMAYEQTELPAKK